MVRSGSEGGVPLLTVCTARGRIRMIVTAVTL
jgi:hypothetical protein